MTLLHFGPRLLEILLYYLKILQCHSRAQLFEGRLTLNPGLNLTLVSFSCVQKHFLG